MSKQSYPFKVGDKVLIPATIVAVGFEEGQKPSAWPYAVNIEGDNGFWSGRLYLGKARLDKRPALQRGPRIPQDWQLVPAAPQHDAIPRILIEALPDVQRVAFEGWLATNRQRPDTYRPSAYYADYVLWYCEYFQREVILHKVEGGRHD